MERSEHFRLDTTLVVSCNYYKHKWGLMRKSQGYFFTGSCFIIWLLTPPSHLSLCFPFTTTFSSQLFSFPILHLLLPYPNNGPHFPLPSHNPVFPQPDPATPTILLDAWLAHLSLSSLHPFCLAIPLSWSAYPPILPCHSFTYLLLIPPPSPLLLCLPLLAILPTSSYPPCHSACPSLAILLT